MKYAKSILMGFGSVVLAGLILTLLVPKAAHAVVATAMQVMNTSANPVPIDEDNSARHAFTLRCVDVIGCVTNPAPATGISVIDFIYIYSQRASGSPDYVSLYFFLGGGQEQFVLIPLTPNANSTTSTAVMPIKLYIDNQSSITLSCAPAVCGITAVGHTVATP